MIHAFLFLTNNNRDRDGHGPEFQFHMHRINQESGTKITVSPVFSFRLFYWLKLKYLFSLRFITASTMK
jgi:hypothetical protein